MDGIDLQVSQAVFIQQLEYGQLGESKIARWLRGRGWNVLPVYEKEIDDGKGPRLFMANSNEKEQLIAPDLLAMRGMEFRWIEAKHKSHFSWYGIGRYWVTGINLLHYLDYLKIRNGTELPIWLMFLHSDNRTWKNDVEKWDAPILCPTGLFGNDLSKLINLESHRSDKYGTTGMVYWRESNLIKLAELSAL